MARGIRQFISIILMTAVVVTFVISGVFFTLILLIIWGILELWLYLVATSPKGKIVTNGRVISVEYSVIEEPKKRNKKQKK